MLLAVATVVSVVWWSVWLARTNYVDAAPRPTSLADLRQQQILETAIDKPGDVELGRLYHSLNVAHFGGTLPQMPVMWEPRLDEVGALAGRTYSLEGMFGRVGKRTVILVHPKLRSDERALRRTLSHEMVHAALFVAGDSSTDHGAPFQAILRRLADEGAFAGILASQDEIDALRVWLDEEAARLAGERQALEQIAQELERERLDLEEAQRRIEASGGGPSNGYPEPIDITTKRGAYNDRAARANERADRYRIAIDAFNREIERYNLMVSYPDGLDEEQIKEKIR